MGILDPPSLRPPSTSPSAVPAAPTITVVTAAPASAVVQWTPPASGFPFTGFVVTASPGGATASAGPNALAATVSGLSNGTAYTFTVRATNAAGNGTASAASASVTPNTGPGGLAITGGCSLWLKADALAYSNGVNVTAWADSSGNGRDCATPVNAPTFLTSWTNGRPAVTFNGNTSTGGTIRTGLTAAMHGSRVTWFVVADITTQSGDRRVFTDQFATTGDSLSTFLDTNATAWRLGAGGGSSLSQAAGTNTPTIISATTPGWEYVNGAKGADGLTCPVASRTYYYWLGSIAGGGGKQFPGRIAEFICYPRTLSDSARQSVEAYLGTKYNITVVAQ